MIKVEGSEDRALVEETCRSRQGHVFQWWNDLQKWEKRSLLNQLKSVNFPLMEDLVRRFVRLEEKEEVPHRIEPSPFISLPRNRTEEKRWKEAKKRGEELLAEGAVAVFTVAGGQGTRLNYPGPKGIFPITPVKKKSFFQLFAERIQALGRKYGKIPPWYIMTSESNHEEIGEYFKARDFFGLDPRSVRFCPQRMIPAVDKEGKFLMESRSRIFMNPNGHGGSFQALRDSGSIEEMRRRGIREIFYFQVDNVLVRIADPIFMGFHVMRGAQMSAKMVRKRDPWERIGVFALAGGSLRVIEYNELRDEERFKKDAKGSFLFQAGSIAIHAISVDFVDEETKGETRLLYHRADKKIPFLNPRGERIEPHVPNGIKFETFVFDALRNASRVVIQEVRREEEFSAVKNAEGEDSPESASRDMTRLYSQWLRRAGISLPEEFSFPIEISPLFALDQEEFIKKVDPTLQVTGPLYLG